MAGKRTSRIWDIDDETFRDICMSANSIADIIRHLGLSVSGAHHKVIKSRINEDSIDISHIQLGLGNRKGTKSNTVYKYTFEEVFKKNSVAKPKNASLIKRLVEAGILNNHICDNCTCTDVWDGKKLSLQLDHINGDNQDNRVENLRLLCPNCHSQTSTFSGRNISAKRTLHCVRCNVEVAKKTGIFCNNCHKIVKKDNYKKSKVIKWPQQRALIMMVKNKGWTNTAKELGVSDNAVRKHLAHSGIDISMWRSW